MTILLFFKNCYCVLSRFSPQPDDLIASSLMTDERPSLFTQVRGKKILRDWGTRAVRGAEENLNDCCAWYNIAHHVPRVALVSVRVALPGWKEAKRMTTLITAFAVGAVCVWSTYKRLGNNSSVVGDQAPR